MRKREKLKPTDSGPNLTPVVNIAMVVLVVFMLTVSFIEPERSMQTNIALLEQGGVAQLPDDWTPPTPLQVLVNASGDGAFTAIVGNAATSDVEQLTTILAERYQALVTVAGRDPEQVQVEISPQRTALWQHVISTKEAALTAGFTNVTFLPGR